MWTFLKWLETEVFSRETEKYKKESNKSFRNKKHNLWGEKPYRWNREYKDWEKKKENSQEPEGALSKKYNICAAIILEGKEKKMAIENRFEEEASQIWSKTYRFKKFSKPQIRQIQRQPCTEKIIIQ